ncbi:MAG: TolC family protein, partial [Caldimonas sp.]
MSARSFRAASRSSRPRRTILNRAAITLLLGLWATAVHADPLTLDTALRLAEVRSRQLPAQDASASAFREMAVAAGQRPDPVLKAGVNNLPITGADRFSLTRDFMTMRSVGAMQEFTRGSKLEARSARFEREAEVARASRDLALANLQRDTAIAWLDRLFQERMRQVLVAQRNETRLQIDGADAVYRGGLGSQADLFVARSAVGRMEDRIAQADRQIATARTQLARWIGAEAAA